MNGELPTLKGLSAIPRPNWIEIDLDARRLDLAVSEEELAKRKADWKWEFDPKGIPPFLRLFCKNAGSLANGAVWE